MYKEEINEWAKHLFLGKVTALNRVSEKYWNPRYTFNQNMQNQYYPFWKFGKGGDFNGFDVKILHLVIYNWKCLLTRKLRTLRKRWLGIFNQNGGQSKSTCCLALKCNLFGKGWRTHLSIARMSFFYRAIKMKISPNNILLLRILVNEQNYGPTLGLLKKNPLPFWWYFRLNFHLNKFFFLLK